MCGICGIAGRRTDSPPLDEPALRRMTAAIVHRGPDDDGHRVEPGVALGMRRLSIIDLAGSAQPLGNEDGSVWTVFNGEIYGYQELRRELAARGHELRTAGDTETIVHLYEDHGDDFPRYLRGMYGVAVWDSRRRRLVLARDRMGEKPLYYAETPRGLAFASEVKSLIAGGLIEPALDPLGAELFLAFGYVPGPHTLFSGVRKLMPASVLVWEDGRIASERRYWDPFAASVDGVGRSQREDEELLLAHLRRSTRAQMISDVPLGVMLSGGLDSSLITALMAEASSGPVSTFSIAFAEDAGSNELPEARSVAERFGTDHHELTTSAVDHPELLDDALWHLEDPIADLSCLGFLLLSRLARQNVTVALSGQGADELLGGYRKHQIAHAGDLARRPFPLAAPLGAAARLAPAGSTAARGLAAVAAHDPVDRLLAMSRVVPSHERERLLAPDFRRGDAEAAIRDAIGQHVDGRDHSVLKETLYLDSRLALVDNMLLYFDKMSMAASLETRVPFLDHEVVELCAALPDSRLVRRAERKHILREVSRGLVDDAIIGKKKRGFFHSALNSWLRVHRDALFSDLLQDERTRARAQYSEGAVRELVATAGERGKKPGQTLFCLLLLEKWQRTFVDPDGPARRLSNATVAAPS